MLTLDAKVKDMTLKELYTALIIANRASDDYDVLMAEDNAEDIAYEVDMLIRKQQEVSDANT